MFVLINNDEYIVTTGTSYGYIFVDRNQFEVIAWCDSDSRCWLKGAFSQRTWTCIWKLRYVACIWEYAADLL